MAAETLAKNAIATSRATAGQKRILDAEEERGAAICDALAARNASEELRLKGSSV